MTNSSALTFYFKEIFPKEQDFTDYMTEYQIADMSVATDLAFAKYLFKIFYRRFHNSNVQYDVPDDFKCDLANILEDNFEKYKKQIELTNKMYALTDDELLRVSEALANSANNPNTAVDDPTKPLEYIGAQAYTIANSNKLQAYLNALRTIPTKLIEEILAECSGLFKKYIPEQIFIYKGGK